MRERRKERRYRFPEKFEVKARVKRQGTDAVYYFRVEDLSMGGIAFASETGETSLELADGDVIDILIYRKNISVRVTAQVLQDPETQKTRAKIIGINDHGREVLSGLLREMAIGAP